MLYDSSATHSFMSHDYVNRLELLVSELPYVLLVSTTAWKLVRTCQCCLSCHFQIDGFVFDLICLPLSGLDLILGMDWLSTNHVMLNCSEKSLVFPTMLVEPVKSVYLFLNSVELGCGKTENQGYIFFFRQVR